MLFIAGIVAVVLLGLLFISSYIKASPDEALIISGLRKKPKIIIGKSGFRIPFLEKKDRLSLKLIPIDVKTSSSVPTADYININVDAVVNVKVSDNLEKINLAAQNFLNKDTEKIGAIAREVLEGNMREIVGQMTLEQMVSDRQTFAEKVKDNAAPDLAKMGLDIVSFNVQNFIDNNNVIEDLGVDNITKIRKKAAIAKAQSEKEIAVEQAKARKEANDAKIESDTQIAIKENALALKKSELDAKAGTEKAKADAAYKIQLEEQRKTLEITTANANIAKQEKEVEIRRKEVEVQEQTLDAQIKKQAEADKYAALQKADADLYTRQKEAEAMAFELQKQAEAEAYQRQKKAEADKAAMEMRQLVRKPLQRLFRHRVRQKPRQSRLNLLQRQTVCVKRQKPLKNMVMLLNSRCSWTHLKFTLSSYQRLQRQQVRHIRMLTRFICTVEILQSCRATL